MSFTPRLGIRRRVRLGVLVGATALAACGETTANVAISAGRLTSITPAGLTGVAGSTLATPIEVRVLGSDEQPLAGATVTFNVTLGGGTVSPASAVSDGNGVARTAWTLGRAAGTNTLSASVGGATTAVNVTGTAGRPATVSGVAGEAQNGTAGSALPIAPAVRVNDANGNAVEGVAVTFTVQSGGGRVTNAVRTTTSGGVATVGSWVLGPTAGAQTLAALVADGGVTNNPVIFTATASAGAATTLVPLSPTTLTGTVLTGVTSLPSVRVNDANGNPVANVPVAFTVTAGNGSITGNTQLSNTSGIVTLTSWILGSVSGANQVTAQITGAAPLVFNATGAAGVATQMTINGGNNQSVQSGRFVPIPPSVLLRDAQGNLVSGASVTFAVATGGGSVIGARQTTDATGIAEIGGWILGTTPGANTLTAAANGVSTVTFAATGAAGAPVSMVANSSTTQSAAAGAAVAAPPSVVVRDLAGNPVPNVVVTFTVASGGGSIVGSPATTNVAGIAALTSWTLGTTAGANSVIASASGLPAVTFNATGAAGNPASVVVVSGDNQVAVQGTALTNRPTVRVLDANGNRVVGTTVTFAVTAGGGSITGATQATDAAGEASVGGWTLGNQAPNTLTATVTGTGITNNPVTFTAVSATQIVVTSIPTGPVASGVPFTVVVQVQNAAGAAVPLSGLALTVAINTGPTGLGGTLTVTTNSLGAASFGNLTLTGSGARTLTIAGTGLSAGITGTITVP